MTKYIIGEQNREGTMNVYCATTREKLGTLCLVDGKYTYTAVGGGIVADEYSNVVKQHLAEQTQSLKAAA